MNRTTQKLKWLWTFSIFVMCTLHMNLIAKDDNGHEADAPMITLNGEILDMQCFMLHPDSGQGPKHAKCATACINKGIAAGFLVEGEVYLLLSSEHESVKDAVAKFGGQMVKINGKKIEHHGVKVFQIHEVQGEPSGSKPMAKGHDESDHSGHQH